MRRRLLENDRILRCFFRALVRPTLSRPPRAPQSRLGCGHFEAGLVLGSILFVSGVALGSTTPSSVIANDKGLADLKDQNAAAAQEKFLQGLASNPYEARLHLNLGLTFEILGQPDKAMSSYQTAAKLADDKTVGFVANFNLGQLAQKAKKVDEALAHYQEALRYNPESVETKTNIELLIQQQQQDQQKQDQQQKDGGGEGQDQQKDQNQEGEGKDPKDQEKQDQGQDDKKKEEPKEYAKNKPQPRKFKSDQLDQADVNKILGEIKQQEQKIRAEFNKKEVKEKPRDKDW